MADTGGAQVSLLGWALAGHPGRWAFFALLIVLAAGRWLLRPLFAEIAHSRVPELFTMSVLLVAIGSSLRLPLVITSTSGKPAARSSNR